MKPIYVYMFVLCQHSDDIFAYLRKGNFQAVSTYNIGEIK